MSCAICGNTRYTYAQNMARTAEWCSRECHSKAVDTGHPSDDYNRWLTNPVYRAAADASASAAHHAAIEDFIRQSGGSESRKSDTPPDADPNH